ncbi:hypothetical protein [Photobacterium leiognathi]|uniref:hypothetical protein n=1 Tax=Photobacterium leiognathi TaxID=553611 RepID=UPI0029819F16|nr:hypothetical protein [Photobacterium leiognathi]
MYFTEAQVKAIADEFMPRVKPESVSAMIDVLCNDYNVLRAAENNGVSHQSLAKNINRLKELKLKLNTLNKHDLMENIWTSIEIRKIYFKALQQGFWEDFPDEGLDNLMSFADKVGLSNVDELMLFINNKAPIMDEFLKKLYLEHKRIKNMKWRISFCFVVQLMLIQGNTNLITVEYLCEKGWDKDIAELVLDITSKMEVMNI